MGRGAPAKKSTLTTAKTHPTYQIMISHAIAELKERTGSSQQAITKYIEANYVIQPETFKAQLKMAFKRLLEKGILETVKKSYKLTQLGRDEHKAEIQIVRKPTTPVAKATVASKKVAPAKPKVTSSKKGPAASKTTSTASKKNASTTAKPSTPIKKTAKPSSVTAKAPAKRAAAKK